MPLADFEINVEFEKGPLSVRVVVYETLKGLRIAASRHENHGSTKRQRRARRGRYSDTLGICHRFENFDREGVRKPQCAIVRLAKPHIGVGMVSHELLHAAVWLRELTEEAVLLTTANDEQLAWVLGELVRQTINTLNARGVYDQ